MNRIGWMVGFALMGTAAIAVWFALPGRDVLQASAANPISLAMPDAPVTGMSVHQSHDKAVIGNLPAAPTDDHGFVLPIAHP